MATPNLRATDGRRVRVAKLIELALAFGLIGALWVGIAWAVTGLQAARCPAAAFLSGSPKLASIFLMVAPGFAAIGPGFIAANWLTGLAPASRGFFDGDPQLRHAARVRRGQAWLLWLSAALLIAGVSVSAVASFSQFCLTPQGIYDRTALWDAMRFAPWSDVTRIVTGCERGSKGTWNTSYRLSLASGRSLDIMDGTAPVWRAQAPLTAALHPYAFAFDASRVDPSCGVGAVQLLTQRP